MANILPSVFLEIELSGNVSKSSSETSEKRENVADSYVDDNNDKT